MAGLMIPGEIDEETLERARKGDDAACKRLVLRYQGSVFALIGRMLDPVRSRGLVAELAEETFLRVFRDLDRSWQRRRGPLASWILTVASDVTRDEIRRRAAVTRDLWRFRAPERRTP